MNIAELGEFGLIRHLTQAIEIRNEGTLVGVGDDCAVLRPTEGHNTLVTTDMLVEGIHFDLHYTPMKHLGYKAASVNISDIYAMGGTPRQLTVSLALDKRITLDMLEEFYAGLRLCCERHGVDIVGGDTTSSLTGLSISITAIGEALPADIVRRNGAHETDLICVSGNLGAAYMGLQLLEREKRVFLEQQRDMQGRAQAVEFQPEFEGREYLLERQLKPEARGDIIEALRKAGIRPTSMMDISDGLSSELMHICQQSKVGCRVYEERIQAALDYQTAAMAEELNLNVTTCALNGGEDYELLFTIPLADKEKAEGLSDVRIIGYIQEESLGQVLVCRDGAEFALKAQGWNPLRDEAEGEDNKGSEVGVGE